MHYRRSIASGVRSTLELAILLGVVWLLPEPWRQSYLQALFLILLILALFILLVSIITWVFRSWTAGATLVDLGRSPMWPLWVFVTAVLVMSAVGVMALDGSLEEGDGPFGILSAGMLVGFMSVLWICLVRTRVTAAGFLNAGLFIEWGRIAAYRWGKEEGQGEQRLVLDVRRGQRLLRRNSLRRAVVYVPAEKKPAVTEVLKRKLDLDTISEGE
ncbi:MAG: hypothetical protein P8129_01155 [Anaerolineae bacterium]